MYDTNLCAKRNQIHGVKSNNYNKIINVGNFFPEYILINMIYLSKIRAK